MIRAYLHHNSHHLFAFGVFLLVQNLTAKETANYVTEIIIIIIISTQCSNVNIYTNRNDSGFVLLFSLEKVSPFIIHTNSKLRVGINSWKKYTYVFLVKNWYIILQEQVYIETYE